ncbi:MAG: hypothetical protein M0008_03600 [Actinomycetota bacterium]|jgi:hypothetical protein|nr:hypothetical protein [Actinomycetota bacterium]
MANGSFVYLTTAATTFQARVTAARLGADGIVTMLRGANEGPYPLPGTVDIFVLIEDEALARELLSIDEEAEAP